VLGVTLIGANVHDSASAAGRVAGWSSARTAGTTTSARCESVLIVAVAAPGAVAALVNWNDVVKVIDAARRSRIDELCEHGHDALEQVDAALVQLAFDQLIELHHVEVRGAFHRGASGDRVVLRLIGPRRTSASLGDVLWDRLRGAPELICQVGVALG
jgi:hypothetical protein